MVACIMLLPTRQVLFVSLSRGDKVTSNLLRQIVCKMMDECLHVCMEDGLSYTAAGEKANCFGSLIMGRRLSHWVKTRYHSNHIC